LNAFWGTGTLIGLSMTGFNCAVGKQKTASYCLLVAVCFGLIILSYTSNPKLLQGALLVFGLASGVTTRAISLMLNLTAAEPTGTFGGA